MPEKQNEVPVLTGFWIYFGWNHQPYRSGLHRPDCGTNCCWDAGWGTSGLERSGRIFSNWGRSLEHRCLMPFHLRKQRNWPISVQKCCILSRWNGRSSRRLNPNQKHLCSWKPGTLILPEGLNEKTRKNGKTDNRSCGYHQKQYLHPEYQLNRMLHSSGFTADVFRHHGVVIDLISTSEVNISCTVNDSERMDELIKDLEELGTSRSMEKERFWVSWVRGWGQLRELQEKCSVHCKRRDQHWDDHPGASEINISCVILQNQTSQALQNIHREFLENPWVLPAEEFVRKLSASIPNPETEPIHNNLSNYWSRRFSAHRLRMFLSTRWPFSFQAFPILNPWVMPGTNRFCVSFVDWAGSK